MNIDTVASKGPLVAIPAGLKAAAAFAEIHVWFLRAPEADAPARLARCQCYPAPHQAPVNPPDDRQAAHSTKSVERRCAKNPWSSA